jgi:cyclopropane-fatty-acyl-phospholipid synthase
MSDLVSSLSQEALASALPDLRRAPAVFKSALGIAAENWLWGSLVLVLPSGRELPIHGCHPGPEARVIIRDYRFIRRVMTTGALGFAEGYIAGEWETPDLADVLESASLNFDHLQQLAHGNPIARVLNFLRHLLNNNSRAGSRRNIHAHYDLGNAFYERWLDPTMSYSSARYAHPDQPLDQAQHHKYETLARSIALEPNHHVLEIGCGWGGFAEFAAAEVGAKVTGVTISRAQYDFARRRLFEQGLAEKADIRLIDYRDVQGQFDRVASIEMFEAVGERYWPTYFSKLHDVLRPGGQAGLQIITIRDELFDDYRSSADFIQKYVFPGGMLGSERRLRQETGRAGLEWDQIHRFGQDYAHTLREWAERFEQAWSSISELGFDERFHRLWRYYLRYCEAGFRSQRTDVVQLSLSRT